MRAGMVNQNVQSAKQSHAALLLPLSFLLNKVGLGWARTEIEQRSFAFTSLHTLMQHAFIGVCQDEKTWEGGKGAWYAHRGKLGESGGWNDVARAVGGRRNC